MYYFIFEQARNKWQAAFQNKIISNLEELQIIGEVARANPIQKPPELFQMGIKKGYNTIVAAGSDTIINSLGALTAKQGITLGIIPIETKSSFFSLIGCENWEQACQALPKRRVETFDIGKINKDKIFLTFVKIQPENKNMAQIILDFKKFKVEVPTLEIIVTNGVLENADPKIVRKSFSDGLLDIFIPTELLKDSASVISLLFQEKTKPIFSSLFRTKKVKISSEEKTFKIISPDNKIIAKTPCEISIIPKAIRIIIKKAVRFLK
ncbi:lipid kinase YegS [subsurface metagenome]